jgi:hypothetical protein
MKEELDPIEPETIDVSVSDLVVIGTPVWAFKATPAINAAIAALKGCDGKKPSSSQPVEVRQKTHSRS